MIIYNIKCLLDMKLSWVTELIPSVIVIHTICTVRILLYLAYKYSGANRMNCSCFNHNNITGFNLNLVKYISYCIVIDSFQNLFLGSISWKTTIEVWTGLAVHYIPHLVLSILILILKCIFIVRMNLYRKCLFCINELNKNRKSVLCLTFPAKCIFSYNIKILIKEHSLVSSFCYTALSVRMRWKLPAFTYNIIIAFLAIYITYLGSAPQIIFKCRLELYNRALIKSYITRYLLIILIIYLYKVIIGNIVSYTNLNNNNILIRLISYLMLCSNWYEYTFVFIIIRCLITNRNCCNTFDYRPVFCSFLMLVKSHWHSRKYRKFSYFIPLGIIKYLLHSPLFISSSVIIEKCFICLHIIFHNLLNIIGRLLRWNICCIICVNNN